ncbi:MAG: ATP-binding cassette domain-containing protein [Candidatus Contubernalis sp.]|nr:ATP-binding cassette domain-containing protein [Candidatus Contubernalis sp.]
MKNDVVLRIENLHKSYGEKKIIDGVELAVKRGDIYGFLGPNGSGKTTTIRMILGLISLDQGNITLNGYDINKDFKKAIGKVGAVVETPKFFQSYSGHKNLKLIIGEQMFMAESVTQVLGFYLLTMIPYIAYAFIILFFSMMFANSGVAIGAAIGTHFMLLFTGGFFEKLQPAILNTYYYMGGLALTKLDWQELLGKLAVIGAYMLVFTVINYITFKKKDILY